ncbi:MULTISPECIES: TetR/AcrR family transcriptional regulator [unclassified Bradyrhizobium]|uniref:TetR/AcrR family transcriptional regulator n=1 Tax=unclassified Bradyrhizobium TaxID=2631580 RepID=UPI002448F3A3|nr:MULTISPECIES: TetR/AcrR family transcriptional regulator [unclassified Bradyrhizobium]MDH2346109.1 TetR/AcrR family transcriptional regulator [Bradyrhizobium sp. SSUT77]MDH2350519.1 TetR/AcrR family transcriptional regulator [Bradyrhizobium sp. SSUT112]
MKTKLTSPAAVAGPEIGGLDERVRRSRAKVLGVTAELLFERGFGGVSVDEISRRSGVAKTTIYRHWPTRTDLLRDACSKIGTPLDVPDTGSFEMDVMALATNLAHLLRTAKWTSVLPSVLDAAERDPAIAEMYSILQRGYSAPFEAVIKRGVRKGELPKKTDAAMLIALLTGPLFYRRWFSRESVSDAFAKQIVRRVIGNDC